jgi:ribosomal-protein-alanine N-acetyltransferase
MQPTFDFGKFPVLSASRTDLCEFDTKYAEDIFAFRGDPAVQIYNSAPHRTVQDTVQFIEQGLDDYKMKKQLMWALRLLSSGRVIGSVSMSSWDRHHRRAEVGYNLAKECWGIGLAQEAVQAVLQFGFEQMALNRVEIWTSAANLRSLHLAERLGFKQDGTLRNRILEDDGQFYDCNVYGLLRSEWYREV